MRRSRGEKSQQKSRIRQRTGKVNEGETVLGRRKGEGRRAGPGEGEGRGYGVKKYEFGRHRQERWQEGPWLTGVKKFLWHRDGAGWDCGQLKLRTKPHGVCVRACVQSWARSSTVHCASAGVGMAGSMGGWQICVQWCSGADTTAASASASASTEVSALEGCGGPCGPCGLMAWMGGCQPWWRCG